MCPADGLQSPNTYRQSSNSGTEEGDRQRQGVEHRFSARREYIVVVRS